MRRWSAEWKWGNWRVGQALLLQLPVASGFCCEWTQERKVFTCWRCADLDLTVGLGVTLGDKWEHLAGTR